MILFNGDAETILRERAADGIYQCCVTSPPYFGLRDYGMKGQVGLEPTPQEYVSRLVSVFREVRRTLVNDGVLWVVIGDSYARAAGKGQHKPGDSGIRRGGGRASVQLHLESESRGSSDGFVGRADRAAMRVSGTGLKPKDLIGIPWMLAFALRGDGWYLRSDIIWSKPNPMPESVTDRCTRSHEYVFMFSKSERYYFDAEAIKESAQERKYSTWDKRKHKEPIRRGDPSISKHVTSTATLASGPGKNHRDVWTITPQPFRGSHFAVFPEALVEPCILAGSQPGDMVLDPFCGSGTVGVVCKRLERIFIGIDLNPEYIEIARNRITTS